MPLHGQIDVNPFHFQMGRTPLHYAMATRKVEQIANMLLKAGASRQFRDVVSIRIRLD